MKVVSPSPCGTHADRISIGHCFLAKDVVCMRICGLPVINGNIHAVVLATGHYLSVNSKSLVTPVNMTAVESDA